MNTQQNPPNRPNCFNCRNFYITYESSHPYGCRAMGFKAKKLPSLVVFESSGLECQLFARK
ncbi:MAG: uracil-DNA glycosylase [Desulfurivibrio sp.]|nr:MAG: uracil-DNA glycosylase [Desulfurivibrio sp.]